MRELNSTELQCVSGGDSGWELEINSGPVKFTLKGDESVQDMVGAVATIGASAYGAAVDATADLFEWLAAGWAYSAACGQGY